MQRILAPNDAPLGRMIDAVFPGAGAIWKRADPAGSAPARPRRIPSASGLDMVFAAKRNLISLWQVSDYKSTSGQMRIFGRQVFLANSPETVKYVMATRPRQL